MRVLGLAVGFAGVLVIIFAGGSSSGSDVVVGSVLTLVGAIGYGCAGLLVRYLVLSGEPFDLLGIMAAQFLCGGILLLPYLAATGTDDTDWGSAKLWVSLAFLVVGAQVITYVGFYVALARWTSARVFAWTFLVPAVAVVVEAVQGDLPSGLTLAGMVVVIGGVAMVTHPRAEPR